MHRRWVTHVQRGAQSVWLPGSRWVELVTSGKEWMIDEDVRLQMEHQISGLFYLMLRCNQSHASPVCPPLDEWHRYLQMPWSSDVQAHAHQHADLSPRSIALFPLILILNLIWSFPSEEKKTIYSRCCWFVWFFTLFCHLILFTEFYWVTYAATAQQGHFT